MIKTISIFVGGFLTGALLIWLWHTYGQNPNVAVEALPTTPTTDIPIPSTETATSTQTGSENTPAAQNTQTGRIIVSTQVAGNMVVVDHAELVADGWIAVHEENNDSIGNVLGAARKDEGTHTNIEVPLLRSTISNTRYWVVLYIDDGDRLFNLATDAPELQGNGEVVLTSFTTTQ